MSRTVRSTKRQLPTAPRIGLLLLTGLGAALYIFPIASTLAVRVIPSTSLVAVLSAALVVAGAALAVWARHCLGANWSGNVVVKQNHELIRTGPYRHVRHPIYTGILLMALGTALELGTVATLTGSVLLGVSFWWKLRMEETFMHEEFGDAYVIYRREVKALIPHVL
jgi:protein-S-isoprenylcysteine O-methyltransferase Ste14